MAVDVVGYSRLISEDEAGTAKAVREHRQSVAPIFIYWSWLRLFKTMRAAAIAGFPLSSPASDSHWTIQNIMVERNGETHRGGEERI